MRFRKMIAFDSILQCVQIMLPFLSALMLQKSLNQKMFHLLFHIVLKVVPQFLSLSFKDYFHFYHNFSKVCMKNKSFLKLLLLRIVFSCKIRYFLIKCINACMLFTSLSLQFINMFHFYIGSGTCCSA
jgi:hypothetical protein